MKMKNQKKSGVAILIADKIDFKSKAVTRDKESQYIICIFLFGISFCLFMKEFDLESFFLIMFLSGWLPSSF